jgi:hypothetical protein
MDPDVVSHWIIIILFILVIGGIVTILVVSSKQSHVENKLIPEIVDIVLFDKGRKRNAFQIEKIDQFMPWVNSIIIIKSKYQVEYDVVVPEYIQTIKSTIPVLQFDSEEKEEGIMNLKMMYPNISDDIIYLSDTTVPIKDISIDQFWSVSQKKRFFNYFQPDAALVGLDKDFEKTFPVLIFNLNDLLKAGSVKDYILSLSLSDKIVFSPGLSKTILLINNEYTDSSQLNSNPENHNFFTTMLINPNVVQQELNQKIINFFID